MNFDAGRVRSMTGPSAVKVRTPVAISARSVDWSAWVISGVCPGGLPEAAPQTQPSMIGWMVAEAADALLRMSAAATNIARTKRLMVTPLRERDTPPHPAVRLLYISCSRLCWLSRFWGVARRHERALPPVGDASTGPAAPRGANPDPPLPSRDDQSLRT